MHHRWGLALVAPLLLLGCLAAEPDTASSPPATTNRTVTQPGVNLTGDWVLAPTDQSSQQLWHITHVGNALSGTYLTNTDIPGYSPDPRPLSGRMQPGGGAGSLDAPGGTLQVISITKFVYCPTGRSGSDCLTATRQGPPPGIQISTPPGVGPITIVPATPGPANSTGLPGGIRITTAPSPTP